MRPNIEFDYGFYILHDPPCHHRISKGILQPHLLILGLISQNLALEDIRLLYHTFSLLLITPTFHIQLDEQGLIQSQVYCMEEEVDGLNHSSVNIARSLESERPPTNERTIQESRIRHIYLEEENIYGRYVPFLLLKDKLKSEVDSTGATALAHMCSHNSPYIPLYLSTLPQGDPILNKPTNMGHTPLDIAGMYCRREYVQLLKKKGAIDNGKVDHWAIQGGNIANWSGQIDVKKKQLIPWAAYNNFSEVLKKYAEAGANMNEVDANGNTPIDLAVINKCYQSVQVLAKQGLRPKQSILQGSQSPFILNLFKEIDLPTYHNHIRNSLKLSFIPLLLLSQFLMTQNANIYFILISLAIWAYLIASKPKQDSSDRPTKFFSQIVQKQINYASNHKFYVLFLILTVLGSTQTLMDMKNTNFIKALYFWILFFITSILFINLSTQFYSIFTNTTPSQLLQSHSHPHLWRKIDYLIARNMVMRVYKNPSSKDYQSNIQQYLNN